MHNSVQCVAMRCAIMCFVGIALTQKTHPLLSRCQPEIDLIRQEMTVLPPPSLPLLAPLVLSVAAGDDGSTSSLPIRVCYSQHVAQRCEGQADAWFSAVLGVPCQLVRRNSTNDSNRGSSNSGSESGRSDNGSSSFSNSAQFLLLSINSLRLLQQKVSPTA